MTSDAPSVEQARPSSGEEAADFQFCASPPAVRETLEAIMQRFAPRLASDEAHALEQALAEALNNVVEHAYLGWPGGVVSVAITQRPGALACIIEDQGRPMPGFRPPEGRIADPAPEIRDLAEGGWGWGIIRSLTRELRYERTEWGNRLCFDLPVAG